MCYISMDLSEWALETNVKFFFSNFELVFEFSTVNRNFFKRIAIYQWIRIDKLYKLIESFIQISNSFSNYWAKTAKYLMHNKVGFMQVIWGRHLCWSAHVLVFIYFALILHDLIEKNNVLLINKLTCPVIKIEKWKHNKTLSVGNLVCV